MSTTRHPSALMFGNAAKSQSSVLFHLHSSDFFFWLYLVIKALGQLFGLTTKDFITSVRIVNFCLRQNDTVQDLRG